MHAPDGFLNAATALGTGAISVGTLTGSLRSTSRVLDDRQVPLAGLTAAFVFAGQMLNFPIGAGTSGHLLGGALAAILIGPHLGALVVAVVVVVQALLFADGGLTALGYNVLNMAIIPAYGGYAVFLGLRKLLPNTGAAVVAASFLGAMLSVVFSATAFTLEFAVGGTATNIDVTTVLVAMVGTHVLIGIGEGFITALTVGSVLGVRPDLVHGASDLEAAQVASRSMRSLRPFLLGGLVVSAVLAVVVSQFASGDPDGLESVAQEQGFDSTAEDSALGDSPLADYSLSTTENEAVGLGVAGLVGMGATFLAGAGLLALVRRGRGGTADEGDADFDWDQPNAHGHDHGAGHHHHDHPPTEAAAEATMLVADTHVHDGDVHVHDHEHPAGDSPTIDVTDADAGHGRSD